MNQASPGKLCPSGRCRPGAVLLGIRGVDGRLVYSPGLGPIDTESAHQLCANGGSSSSRFIEPSLEKGCANWSNESCGVATAASLHIENTSTANLPSCGIRHQCRWFDQEGPAICHLCPLIYQPPLCPRIVQSSLMTGRTVTTPRDGQSSEIQLARRFPSTRRWWNRCAPPSLA